MLTREMSQILKLPVILKLIYALMIIEILQSWRDREVAQ